MQGTVWRPRWYAWAALGVAIVAVIDWRVPRLLHGHMLVVSIVLIAALLYALQRLWELPPAVMMCMGLALSVFSGSWGVLGMPSSVLPDRLLLLGALLALMLRSPGSAGRPRIEVRNVHLLLALTTLYALASAAAVGTLGSKEGVFDLLDQLGAIPFVMLLVAPVVFSGSRERNMLLATLVGLGAYLGVTAVFEATGLHSLVFPHYIALNDAATPNSQAGGPFRAPITEGFACFACGTAAVIAFMQWKGSRWRYFAGGVAIVCVLGCFATLERGVWIAAAAGVLTVGLADRQIRRRLLPAIAVCAVALAGVLVASPSLANSTSTRANDQMSVWDRQNQSAAAMRMIAAKPLFGFGWDRYSADDADYFRQSPDYPMTGLVNTAGIPGLLHDTYLSFAVQLGLVGGLLWAMSLMWGVGGAIFSRGSPELRPWKLGLLAILVFFCVLALFNPLQQNFSELLLWTWAGVAFGAARGFAGQRSGVPVRYRSESAVGRPSSGPRTARGNAIA